MHSPSWGLSALLAAMLLTGCAKPATPQVEGPLAIDIPELCTQCVEVLRCEGDGRRTVYVLDEKSAWAQIATIWDYMAQFFRPKVEDFRDLKIYQLAADGETVVARTADLQARLDVWQRRVELPDSVVEQKTGRWLGLDGKPQGTCRHLPRTEDRNYARQLEERTP
ncbi:MAG TPA: hypothetical protein P5528_07935 [Steroidobacteraceae bacterium]|nr:hypothetical protein [Steroidobacteraceae bacterium]HRX89362.1 hypothetical protein [Steroidobacteraceae bacterium]